MCRAGTRAALLWAQGPTQGPSFSTETRIVEVHSSRGDLLEKKADKTGEKMCPTGGLGLP